MAQRDEMHDLGEAMRGVGQAGDEAARGADAMGESLTRSRGAFEELVKGFQNGSASLQARWHDAVDDVMTQVARMSDGLLSGSSSLSGAVEGLGAAGSLFGMAQGHGSGPHVTFDHPRVPLPPGAMHPGAVGVTIAEGAVQITAQSVDDSVLAHAAEMLAADIQARLAFEDRRFGK